MMRWTKTIQEDPESGDLFVDITEACEVLGWQEGDTLDWIDNKNGTWSLQKVKTSV